MSFIKKYNQFIKESFTEFNLQRLNPDSVQASMHVDDPQLSLNAFDKNQDLIRQAMSRINDIMFTMKGTNAYGMLRSRLALEDQDIKALRILRMVKSPTLGYDVFIVMTIGDQEYWGKISDITTSSPEFSSEVFKDHDLYQPKEWIVKIKGLVIKTIKAWLKPEPGFYRLMNEEVICYSTETGKQLRMEKGIEIEVVRAHDNKIIIKHETDTYNLINDNFIFFNWWFEKIGKALN